MASKDVYKRFSDTDLYVVRQALEPLSRAKRIPRPYIDDCATKGNIAAIDFGTTYVSLAYTTLHYKDVNTLPLDKGVDRRVSNSILLFKENPDTLRVCDIGSNAQNSYFRLRNKDKLNYIYFERIKMLLKKEKVLNRETVVESINGLQFYLVEVIAFIIKELAHRLIDHLSRTWKPLKTTDFDWVITVPAIWDARGKRMMREAAYLSGILSGEEGITSLTPVGESTLNLPNEVNAASLHLALEPEAAAIYSQVITQQELKKQGKPSAPCQRYMVVDVGGGTVDITAQMEVDGGIEVINIPSGNAWGGTQVNEQFSQMLQSIVGDQDFSRFLNTSDLTVKATRRAVLTKLIYVEFESEKVAFGTTSRQQNAMAELSIALPKDFLEFYTPTLIEKQTALIPGVEFDDDSLYINVETVEERLFSKSIAGIIDCTIDALKAIECKVDVIYLVGGFGGSKYVYEKLKAALIEGFPLNAFDLKVPTAPSLAIATGAVMWRQNPSLIKARRADATYGIGISPTFKEGKHDPHYKIQKGDHGSVRCKNVFKVFLQKGELARSDEVFTSSQLSPADEQKAQVKVNIFTTPYTGVQYVIDKHGQKNVTKIGELVIDVPHEETVPNDKRTVEVIMDFSGTEIKAKARNIFTGNEVHTVCDFLSSQI